MQHARKQSHQNMPDNWNHSQVYETKLDYLLDSYQTGFGENMPFCTLVFLSRGHLHPFKGNCLQCALKKSDSCTIYCRVNYFKMVLVYNVVYLQWRSPCPTTRVSFLKKLGKSKLLVVTFSVISKQILKFQNISKHFLMSYFVLNFLTFLNIS